MRTIEETNITKRTVKSEVESRSRRRSNVLGQQLAEQPGPAAFQGDLDLVPCTLEANEEFQAQWMIIIKGKAKELRVNDQIVNDEISEASFLKELRRIEKVSHKNGYK